VRFEWEHCDEDLGCAMRAVASGLGSGGVLSRGQHQGGRFVQRQFCASFSHSVPQVGLMPENGVGACWLG
jgi:hypothetical protein